MEPKPTFAQVTKDYPLLTPKQAAEWLDMDAETVSRHVRTGKLPGFHVPGVKKVLVNANAIVAMVEGREYAPDSTWPK